MFTESIGSNKKNENQFQVVLPAEFILSSNIKAKHFCLNLPVSLSDFFNMKSSINRN